MKKWHIFISSIIAGICIAIGGSVYLSCVIAGQTENGPIMKVIGAILFASGLFAICTFRFHLYTGKVGYLVNEKPSYLIDLLIIFLGNLIGTVAFGYLILFTRDADKFTALAKTMVDIKLNDNLLSIFCLSIGCGFLMHFAVDCFKKLEANYVARYIAVFLGVSLFILCGFEHVVANFFYITIAKSWGINCILPILIMAIGNALGAFIISLYEKIKKSA